MDSTFSRYTVGFYHFSILTLILPFFGTRSDSFSVLARILPFPATRPYSILFQNWPWFYLFLVLVRTVFRYSHGFYHFMVLTLILLFFRYSSEQFFGTRMDSTFFRYSPGFYHFRVLTLILPFFDTRLNSFSVHARILPFHGTRRHSIIFRYWPWF